jgi:hypothetical protein
MLLVGRLRSNAFIGVSLGITLSALERDVALGPTSEFHNYAAIFD